MDVGHSRLLKFFVKGDRSKMAEKHQLTIEVLTPTNIEAEVPRHQQLRAPENVPEDPTEPIQGPVYIENGAPISWGGLRNLLNPVYVGEPVRTPAPPRVRASEPEKQETHEDNSPEEKKVKTRIPVSRFKNAVTRVQDEKKEPGDVNEPSAKKQAPEKPPRRSSIPKLSDRLLAARNNTRKTVTNDKTDNHDKDPVRVDTKDHPLARAGDKIPVKVDRIHVIKKDVNKQQDNEDRINSERLEAEADENETVNDFNEATTKETNDKLDDEFDKLYDEIVDTEVESLPEEILNTKVKDPEKLESKFEEIVHQYDEETVEQVKVEPVDKARYSKIPLLKRRSEQEIKIPKKDERRLSLKTGLKNIAKINAELQANDEKLIPSTPSVDVGNLNNGENEPIFNREEKTQEEMGTADDNGVIEEQSPMLTPAYNVIPTPDAELVKVGISNFGISLERNLVTQNVNSNTNNDIATPEPETMKVAVLDVSNESNDLPADTGETKEMGYLVEEFVSMDAPQTIENVFEIDKPGIVEVSETNLTVNNDISKDDVEEDKKIPNENDTVKVATIDFNIPVTKQDEKSPIPDTVSEFKSVNLLRGTSGIEERSKSRYVNKPIKSEGENHNINNNREVEEEIPVVKGKVSRILRRLTSQDDNSNNDETKQVKLKSDDAPLKGNVSKIINRMTSQDVDPVKKEIDEIPKKKSVLSRIAMFERPAQEPIVPKKQPYKYSKPQRTISEEIRHSPKIVQEVLKPHMRNGQTNTQTDKPYEVITIDISQPAEIVVNNEEQVLVVEELKEETVVYENLDNSRVEIVNEPKEALVIDEVITTGNSKNEPFEFPPKEVEIDANDQPESLIVTEQRKSDDRPNFSRYKSREAVKEYVPVKEKIKRLKSHEDGNLRKAKSTAELDIGEAVKGKVKNMIVRMNSMDFLDDRDDLLEEKEKISAKERPRKRSVSEKIALFERKLTPVKMEDVKVDSGRALDVDPKPKQPANAVNSVGLPAKVPQPVDSAPPPADPTTEQEYNDKIRELLNAKMTHGSVTNMSYIQLSDGRKMPVLALGTALLDLRLAKHIVASAIDLGFRAIDTAFIYGTEKEVGEGIRAKIQDGTVKREELFIMSKLWSTCHSPARVAPACRASLAALGLDYFDLFMIHNPMSFKEGNDPLPKIANVLQFSSHDYLDAWFAMEELVSQGLARSLGLSNFNSEQVARVAEKGRIKPVVDQVECHPYLSQQRLFDFCDTRDVRLSCFGTLGSPGTPLALKASAEAAIDDPLVQVMAAGLGISPAQLLIRYQIELGHGVVVKASSAAHQWDVLGALAATLAPEQVAAIQALNRNKRAFTFKGMGDTHRNYPFKIPF